MKMMKKLFPPVLAALFLIAVPGFSQRDPSTIKTAEYAQLQKELCTGWNTWYNNSMLSHVYLPDGFSLSVCLDGWGTRYLKENFKVSKALDRPESLIPGLRSDKGDYTSMRVQYDRNEVQIESAVDGDDLLLLVTPLVNNTYMKIVIEAGIHWNKPGFTGHEDGQLFGKFGDRTIMVGSTETPVYDPFVQTTQPSLVFSGDKTVGLFTGRERSLQEIREFIDMKREEQVVRAAQYGELSDAFMAMQSILAWNTIYDDESRRAITPVSRIWNAEYWNGFVLFDWDTYFAAYMLSLFNKELAYANAVEITKAITPEGFIPNYIAAYNNGSWDRSQPPVGSFVVNGIYKKYQEKWFLEEVYEELLSWNRWWVEMRSNGDFLSWGSSPVADPNYRGGNDFLGSILESGLDNSPMYDSIPFDTTRHVMEMADVGLLGFYIRDCKALAEISGELGKTKEKKELERRAKHYTKVLNRLWSEEDGIFYNLRTDNGEVSKKLSPTNFYPLLAGAASQKQAERMIREHYFNPEEFHGEYILPSIARNVPGYADNTYWRGRIWAPMNFLVYMGMRNYDLPEAREDLVKRSYDLLMKSWKVDGAIYENYNADTGEGDDMDNADSFYHWGALLTFISFIENGYLE
jgi:putative isomerase